jgi:hypothetical protein
MSETSKMLAVLAIFAMLASSTVVEARLAPPGNQYDREAITKEAWFALTQQVTPYGPFQQGQVGNWNYLSYDVPAAKEIARRFNNNPAWVGFTAWGVINGDLAKGYFDSAGRGGQCLFFVNLLLYRSEADRRQYVKSDNYVCHYCWSYVNARNADINTLKAGDVIFIPSTHAALAVRRNGDNVEIVESNFKQPEKIAYRTTTISALKSAGYKVYTGVDYYNN